MIHTKTEPRPYQLDEVVAHGGDVARGLLWTMRSGKSKTTIDRATRLQNEVGLEGQLVVAPNPVQLNWVLEEWPAHSPLDWAGAVHVNSRVGSNVYRAELECVNAAGFGVLAMTYESLWTPKGFEIAKWFLSSRRAMMTLDESHKIKTSPRKSNRTKAALQLGRFAAAREILTGTFIPNGPPDAYYQMEFLEPGFWRERYGIGTFTAFKRRYVRLKRITSKGGSPLPRRKQFDITLGYRRVEELWDRVKPLCSRITNDDLKRFGHALPEKVYSTRSFEMSAEQRRHYNELRDECLTQLESGERVIATMPAVNLLRLQQITCGYVGTGEAGECTELPGPNPRFDLLCELVESSDVPLIVWARFRRDIDRASEWAEARGIPFARIDGHPDYDNWEEKEKFQRGDAHVVFANPAAGAHGIRLDRADVAIYYSNSFNFEQRDQSEARVLNVGKPGMVQIIDLAAVGTVDRRITANLREKREVFARFSGETLKEWLG